MYQFVCTVRGDVESAILSSSRSGRASLLVGSSIEGLRQCQVGAFLIEAEGVIDDQDEAIGVWMKSFLSIQRRSVDAQVAR